MKDVKNLEAMELNDDDINKVAGGDGRYELWSVYCPKCGRNIIEGVSSSKANAARLQHVNAFRSEAHLPDPPSPYFGS